MEEERRSGNYAASIWDDDYVQSLASPYSGGEFTEHADKLKRKVQTLINETQSHLDQLELIDNLQRLDISNHFEDGVQKILEAIYRHEINIQSNDLHFAALRFRLLRQHGYHVPQEVFGSFIDEKGNFKACIANDTKGLLSLYEASFLSLEGETILDSAKYFSTRRLNETLQGITDPTLAEQIKHALELPLHWRVQKLEAIWFIHSYESRPHGAKNLDLLQLAKLDFNMVQAKYQREVKQLSSWYKETGIPEKMDFARHRLAEGFLWAVGFTPELKYEYSREISVKMVVMVTVLDDIYDVHGTLDELEVLTDMIQRWDINGLDRLPVYMRIFVFALFNFVNEMAYRIMRDQGLNIISNLQKLWAELSRAYYLEAQWIDSGHYPSMDEYMNTAWVSIGGPLALLHTYLSSTNPINKNELRMLEQYPSVIRCSSMLVRLADDLGTASDEMKKGDVPKCIQCYMRDTGCCEEDARKHIRHLIEVTMKKMNKDVIMVKPLPNFVTASINLARTSLGVYQFGDGFGSPHGETKKNMISLIVEPIFMP